MSLISWNCRGLGNLRSVRDLCHMVKEKRPNFVFLMETISTKHRMELLRVKMGFAGALVVNPVGRSGGLALMWKNDCNLEIYNYSRRHINAIIKTGDDNFVWKFTGFYGNPETAKREESWLLLRHLKTHAPLPWLCVGDFNEILSQDEKVGEVVRRERQMDGFRIALEDCQLGDLGYVGSRFTWSNKHGDNTFTKERLDRAVANSEWCGRFPIVSVMILAARTSDHSPVHVLFREQRMERYSYKRRFKFEDSWYTDVECRTLIAAEWENDILGGDSMHDVQRRLSACQHTLSRWSLEKFGNAEKQLKLKTKQLADLQSRACPENAGAGDISKLQGEIDGILEREDIRWKQRAKQNWYRSGDRNTQYFHAWANHRKKINGIQKICDESGRVWEKKKEVSKAFIDYYRLLFTSQGLVGVDECLSHVESRITVDMNDSLLRPFTEAEVSFALSQMHPLKSPGPDGFAACFYQKSWGTVGKTVSRAVLQYLNEGVFYEGINATNIVLIPKVSAPTCVTEYRPISLCNVIYKLIAKVLANRLKVVLPHVISTEQSAFIPGRLITDNILVAFETLHTMDTRLQGKEGFMALKLDMSKAYDRIEWGFLEAILYKLGFAPRWIQLLMTCVRTVTYSILINGQPHGRTHCAYSGYQTR